MRQYALALNYFEQSLQMKLLSLPSNHPDLGDAYANIAAVYERQNNPQRALSFYERAQMIYVQSLPPNHSRIIKTEEYIQHLKEILS